MVTVAAVVVLYDPDIDIVVRNINSYYDKVKMLFIIDNSKVSCREQLLMLLNCNKTLRYVFNGTNEGVAKALNKGATLAMEQGYEWLLTMDQDSFFEDGTLNDYLKELDRLMVNDQLAVIGVSHDPDLVSEKTIRKVNAVITSGSLIRLSIWNDLNGFNEGLFIDEVDHEYCYRVIVNGCQVVQLPYIQLDHKLGKMVQTAYIGLVKGKERILHSPARVYFMVRNYLYVRNKYKLFLPAEFKQRNKVVWKMVLNNLLFSGSFLKVLKNIIQGYIDYRKRKFSRTI